MGKRETILDPEVILTRIERQLDQLNMTKQELSTLTYITYPTLINNFQKKKIPMFNDLYKISLAIGMPVDDLLAENEPDCTENEDNILAWRKLIPGGHYKSSFLLHIQDKVAIAKTFRALAEKQSTGFDPTAMFMQRFTLSIDDLRFYCFLHTITMHRADSIFIFSKMSEMVNAFFSNKTDSVITFPEYRKAQNKMALSVWVLPYLPTQNLWTYINKRIPEKYPTLSSFLKDAKLNSQTYGKYLNACNERSTPSTESVYRICRLLDITDLDSTIRGNLPEIPSASTNAARFAGVLPHEIENDVIRNNLKALPYLAMFYDCVFSLNYESLSTIQKYITDSVWHPFSSSDYIVFARTAKECEFGVRFDEIGHRTNDLWADYSTELNIKPRRALAETITETKDTEKDDNL